MAQDQKELSGAIFKNDRQREGRQDPGYNGSCTIEGKKYWISAWVKDGTKGKFFSLAFKANETAPAPRKATVQQENINSPNMDDSDVPF
jgi:hypothetical protein